MKPGGTRGSVSQTATRTRPRDGDRRRKAYGPFVRQGQLPVLLDAEALLTKYRNLLDIVEATALSPEKSRDLIHSIAQNL
ncbi:hypothetical protein QF027_004212 [Streptomyces canus]|nr:hypothetical protein [Streptomyces canus]